jgi:hypothetical protein
LEETNTTNLLAVPYLDIQQGFHNSHGRLVVRTGVHDRRRGPEFQGLCLAGFPHATCAFAAHALVSMVRAAVHRRMRLVNSDDMLVVELAAFARELEVAGYTHTFIVECFRSSLANRPYLLNGNTPAILLREIQQRWQHPAG